MLLLTAILTYNMTVILHMSYHHLLSFTSYMAYMTYDGHIGCQFWCQKKRQYLRNATQHLKLSPLLLQYFSLSIFFWLTSMSLDIWLAFRVMANPVQDLEKKETQLKSRTKIFYAFSFGSPMVVTAVTGILQFARDPAVSSYIHPRYQLYQFLCWSEWSVFSMRRRTIVANIYLGF